MQKNGELFISITTEQIITNKKLESWFVTPAFNIIRGKSFTFDCLLENPSSNTLLEVYLWQESDEEMIAIPIGTESIKSTGNEWKGKSDLLLMRNTQILSDLSDLSSALPQARIFKNAA